MEVYIHFSLHKFQRAQASNGRLHNGLLANNSGEKYFIYQIGSDGFLEDCPYAQMVEHWTSMTKVMSVSSTTVGNTVAKPLFHLLPGNSKGHASTKAQYNS